MMSFVIGAASERKPKREHANDERRSIKERYQSRAQHTGLVAEAAAKLVKEDYLPAEDFPALIKRAGGQRNYVNESERKGI